MPAKFTDEDIIERVKSRFGYPVVNVELDETQITDAIEDSLEIFQKYRPKVSSNSSSFLNKGVHRLDPPEGHLGLLDVEFIRYDRLDNMSVEANLLHDPFYFISSGAIGGMDVTLYDLTRHWIEIVGREFSAEFDYEYKPDLGLYLFLPADAKVKIEWAMPYGSAEEVPTNYQHLFLKLVTGKSRQILGHIRSKYSGVPGAGGIVQMDGQEQLIQGRQEEEEAITEMIRISPHYVGFFG